MELAPRFKRRGRQELGCERGMFRGRFINFESGCRLPMNYSGFSLFPPDARLSISVCIRSPSGYRAHPLRIVFQSEGLALRGWGEGSHGYEVTTGRRWP